MGEQATGTADNVFTISKDTASGKVWQNERDCREVRVASSVEQPGPVILHLPTKLIPELRTFTETYATYLLKALCCRNSKD